MNRWVLKKLSKDTFDGLVDYVKDIKKKLQDMYVCVPHVRKRTTHRDRNLYPMVGRDKNLDRWVFLLHFGIR
jgi:hypothetical protein